MTNYNGSDRLFRVLFLYSDTTSRIWQTGQINVPADQLNIKYFARQVNSPNPLPPMTIQPSYGCYWAYHTGYGLWIEIPYTTYMSVLNQNLAVTLTSVKVSLLVNNTNINSLIKYNGQIEVWVERLGYLRPSVIGMNKLDGTTLVQQSDAPYYVAVWNWGNSSWLAIRTDLLITTPDANLITVGQCLLSTYITNSGKKNLLTDISIIDDHELANSNQLLVTFGNRNIDSPKYMPSTCTVSINYSGNILHKTLLGHYYPIYQIWNQ